MNRLFVSLVCFFIPKKENRDRFWNKHVFDPQAELRRMSAVMNRLEEKIDNITRKISYQDAVYYIQNAKFYLPNYPMDEIQRVMVNTNRYWEQDLLESLPVEKYDVIFDIGANIGSHSVYWAREKGSNEIHAFEPIRETFEILKKNVEINGLGNIVRINNVGLSSDTREAEIARDCNYSDNMAATRLCKSDGRKHGGISMVPLDKYVKEEFSGEGIDLIKIDVELFEIEVLQGAKETLTKFSPVIFIEAFSQNFDEVDALLKNYGYIRTADLPAHNYIYKKESR